MELVLHFSIRSTCSQKVRICLAEKGLPYAERRMNLQTFEHHKPEYLALNPNGYVPTLVHNSRPFIESTLINEYLDEAFSDPPLRPSTAEGRHAMRIWTKFADETCLPAVVVPTWSNYFARGMREMSEEERNSFLARVPLKERRDRYEKLAATGYSDAEFADALSKLKLMADRIEATLATSDWLAGSAYSLADIALTPYVRRGGEIEPSLLDGDKRPRLVAWLARIKARPSWQDVYRELEMAA